ncbi:MAG: NAD(P) transhydrogenase subunit alpha [Spirochaeta sp. LUC14_002_19_P3]|nr:MAG: NAD(P) transhydrogenase subunit alpha [Spirochaeta sp. LUC14_002_19_P3]
MIIAVPKEADDSRSALIPDAVKKLLALKDVQVLVESGLSDYWEDEEFLAAGAKVEKKHSKLLESADVVMKIHPSEAKDLKKMKKGALHISHLDPYNNRALVEAYAAAGVNAVSLEMIPRTTLAQKMDVLSSQASLAGYAAVILAAERLGKILPMMMTPAGTLAPAKVFVIGAGVAGLQAIATAKRLGARVEAFDTRPVVEEQVQSLGAKFLKVNLGETGQTKDGYAKALTDEQLAKQREAMARAVAQADITITTAKLFGRKAPVIITADMLKGVKKGSVIVDLAAGSGGNVEGVKVDKEIEVNGVHLIGIDNMPGEVALNASQMLASNMVNLVSHLLDAETGALNLGEGDKPDEIAVGCVIVRGGKIVHQSILDHYKNL